VRECIGSVTDKKIETIEKNIDIGIVGVDSKGIITECNPMAKKIFGIKSNKRVIGESILDIFPESDIFKVLESGVEDKKIDLKYKGKRLLIHNIPVIDEGEIHGVISLIYDETSYISLVEELNKEKHSSKVLNTILEMVYDGILVVDKDGYISMISKAYAEFLEIDRKDVVGKHVTEVIENTRMHIVAETGMTETAQLQKLKGRYMIATRVPIIKEGKVEGAVGKVLFRNLKDFNSLYNKISKIEKEVEHYKGEAKESNSATYSFDNIIGSSSKLEEAKILGKKAALTNSNVLLKGESGTGKELFAHAIHKASDRVHGNFVKVNCAAIPIDLLESELFGYEKGSFTGAKKEGKIGKFELADGGTIFLDEIGDMPLHMQAKLLRVLQEKEVEKIGAVVTKKIDIRVIAATNRNLEEMVKSGGFREDLYYRLNVVTINIPPLRERPEDIVTLTSYLIDKICKKLDKNVKGITRKAMEHMKNYKWEGNVRQLENVIERAINIVEYGKEIKPEHLPYDIAGKVYEHPIERLDDSLNKAERDAILNALSAFNGNKSKVAKALDISRTTLYEKMTKHNILG
jgi:PAS domain S-box-containing protein